MPEPLIATEDIPFYGVLAFTAGQVVPDDWAELHPDLAEGRTARRTPELVEEVTPGLYDPGEHTVDEVLVHLADADQPERDRVLAAETAGKNRKGIIDAGQES